MKKLVISISLALISLATVFLCGCDLFDKNTPSIYDKPTKYAKVEDNFSYVLVGEDGKLAGGTRKPKWAHIIGYFGERGPDNPIEELVIPTELGGYPVGIGYSHINHYMGSYVYYGIDGKYIKRVVINHDVNIPYYGLNPNYVSDGLIDFEGELIINSKAEIDFRFPRSCYIEINVDTSLVTIDSEPYEEFVNGWTEYEIEYNKSGSLKEVTFNAMGGQQKTYSVFTKDGFIKEPEAPIKEGYTFDGWYTDETYQTKWDFENDIVPYTKDARTKLYAKWI